MYCAIIGDIIGSRELENRADVQKALNLVLGSINERYADKLASPFMITLGDEFQGLLTEGGTALGIIDTIDCCLYPVRIRYGIGIAEMSTEINPGSCLGSDGPAYWYARDALKYIHDNNDYGRSRRYLLTDCGNAELVNSNLRLCDNINSGLTESQREFVFKVKPYLIEGHSQIAIAEALGISPQSVNNKFKSTGLRSVVAAERAVSNYLSELTAKEEKRVC